MSTRRTSMQIAPAVTRGRTRCIDCFGRSKQCPSCGVHDARLRREQEAEDAGQILAFKTCPIPACRNVSKAGEPCRDCRRAFGSMLRMVA